MTRTRSPIGTFGATSTLSLRATSHQVTISAAPISRPGTMPAMNSLEIDTPPITPNRMKPIDGGITGAMMPPAAISPAERSMR